MSQDRNVRNHLEAALDLSLQKEENKNRRMDQQWFQ